MADQGYNPSAYWREEGKTYRRQFRRWTNNPVRRAAYKSQERLLLTTLREITFNSVLEIGCGFGRITRLLVTRFPDIARYDALDLSPEQLENARSFVSSQKVEFHCATFQDFKPPADTRYDLVLASEVLLHVPPSDIESFVQKMVSLSSKHVIHIDWHPRTLPAVVASHNFAHDYEAIYRRLGSQITGLNVVPVRGTVFRLIPMYFDQAIYHATVA